MSEAPSQLWLHAPSGRENGLMVIGTPEGLKELGAQLQTAGEFASKSSTNWPTEIAHPWVAGPYKDVPDFQLSFHIAGDIPISAVLPLTRRSMPTPLLLVISACAVVGLITIVRWVVSIAI